MIPIYLRKPHNFLNKNNHDFLALYAKVWFNECMKLKVLAQGDPKFLILNSFDLLILEAKMMYNLFSIINGPRIARTQASLMGFKLG